MLILVLVFVLKDSLKTYFKSLSLSWSLGSGPCPCPCGVRSRRSLSLSWSLGVRSLSLGVRSLSLSWSLGVRYLLTSLFLMQTRKHNLTLNLKKCIFAKPKVKFIGNIVGSGTIEMNPDRTESLLKMKIPETKKQVKQILGLFSYYRQFVNNFAHIAKLLSDLTR